MKLYLAGPVFTAAERVFNADLRTALVQQDPNLLVLLPQEFVVDAAPSLRDIFHRCISVLRSADAVLAVLDGAEADSGTCVELGVALGARLPVVGIRTDQRGSGELDGVNLMVYYACERYLHFAPDQLATDNIARETLKALRALTPGSRPQTDI